MKSSLLRPEVQAQHSSALVLYYVQGRARDKNGPSSLSKLQHLLAFKDGHVVASAQLWLTKGLSERISLAMPKVYIRKYNFACNTPLSVALFLLHACCVFTQDKL